MELIQLLEMLPVLIYLCQIMKVLELTIYATKWPYIEFTSCTFIPFLEMARDYGLLQSFYD